jgi:hypothetical protein
MARRRSRRDDATGELEPEDRLGQRIEQLGALPALPDGGALGVDEVLPVRDVELVRLLCDEALRTGLVLAH